jgi:Ala-tRNA(Pro) deacylase
VPGKTLAKVVMAIADNDLVMFVLPAPYRLDTKKAAAELDVDELRVAHENEFAGRFPDCDVGAMPPVGKLYEMDTYVDQSLAEDEYIVFQAGTHTDVVRVKYEDYAKAVKPVVVDIAHRA